MYKYIWLVPLLPLIGAAINGLLGRKLRFSEPVIGGIAVGSVALAFLISVAAVYSYGFGGHPQWPNPYLTSQDGFSFNWIPGGAVSINQGSEARREAQLHKQIEERTASMTPEERAQAGPQVYGTIESPQYALLNVEWSYQLDPLSAVFMLIVGRRVIPWVLHVVAHMGSSGPGYIDQHEEVMAVFGEAAERRDPRMRNLYFDISSNVVEDPLPKRTEALARRVRQLGTRRILYGSDLSPPGGGIRQSWELFRSKIPLTPAEFESIARNRPRFAR